MLDAWNNYSSMVFNFLMDVTCHSWVAHPSKLFLNFFRSNMTRLTNSSPFSEHRSKTFLASSTQCCMLHGLYELRVWDRGWVPKHCSMAYCPLWIEVADQVYCSFANHPVQFLFFFFLCFFHQGLHVSHGVQFVVNCVSVQLIETNFW